MKKEYKITKKEVRVMAKLMYEEKALAEQEKRMIEFFLEHQSEINRKKHNWWEKQAENYDFKLKDNSWIVDIDTLIIYSKKGETLGTSTD